MMASMPLRKGEYQIFGLFNQNARILDCFSPKIVSTIFYMFFLQYYNVLQLFFLIAYFFGDDYLATATTENLFQRKTVCVP